MHKLGDGSSSPLPSLLSQTCRRVLGSGGQGKKNLAEMWRRLPNSGGPGLASWQPRHSLVSARIQSTGYHVSPAPNGVIKLPAVRLPARRMHGLENGGGWYALLMAEHEAPAGTAGLDVSPSRRLRVPARLLCECGPSFPRLSFD